MQRETAIAERVGVVRPDRDRPVAAGDGLIEAPELLQRVAAVAERFGIVRIDGDRLVVARHRFIVTLDLDQRIAAIAPRFRQVRLDGQRLVEARQRVLEAPQLMQDDAAIGPGRGGSRVEAQCLFQQAIGLCMATALTFGHAETVEGVEMGGNLFEDLSIKGLGVGDETAVLQQHGLGIDAAHLLQLLLEPRFVKGPRFLVVAHHLGSSTGGSSEFAAR